MATLKLGVAAVLAVCALGGCSRDKLKPCDPSARYAAAESVPPVRIPDDLSPPNESDALRLPPENAITNRAAAGCLEAPPAFNTSGRGTAAPAGREPAAEALPEPAPGGDRDITN